MARARINPYVVGVPIREPDMFFGREDMLDTVRRALVDRRKPTSVVFYGGRRVGKSSVLYQIRNGRLGHHFIAPLTNMEDVAETDTEHLLRRLASDAATVVGVPPAEVHKLDWAQPYEAFTHFLTDATQRLEGRTLLFLVDECERIRSLVEREKVTVDIYGYMKSLTESELNVAFVFTGSRRLQLERDRYLPHLFSACEFYEITFLERDPTEKLIREPVAGVISYSDDAVECIWELAAGHPFFTQLLCQKLFQYLADTQESRCDRQHVQAASQEIVNSPPPHLSYVWQEDLDDRGKLVTAALAELVEDDDSGVSPNDIASRLSESGVALRPQAVAGVLSELKLQGIVRYGDSPREASLALGFYAYWLRQQHPLAATVYEATRQPGWHKLASVLLWAAGLIGLLALVLVTSRSPTETLPPLPPDDADLETQGPFPPPPSQAAVPTPSAVPGWRTHELPDLGFSMDIPDKWHFRREDKSDQRTNWPVSVARFQEDPESKRVQVKVEVTPGCTLSAARAQEQIEHELRADYADKYRFIGNIAAQVHGASEVVRWEFVLQLDEVTLRKIVQYVVRGDTSYGIVCQAPEEDFARYSLVFEKALNSLKLSDRDGD